MRRPGIHYLSSRWLEMAGSCERKMEDGSYIPCRPEPFHCWNQRWRAAWLVFTGQADALIWPETWLPWIKK